MIDGHPAEFRGRLAIVAGVVAVAVGVALRCYSVSELWLDEALSVNIASLPLDELSDALRQDGAPPLYYVLLHAWLAVFGESNVAVRLLSTVFSVFSLPLAWLAGMRLGGRRIAFAALVLMATSPFAIRYGTEARMYALVQFLVLAGYLVVTRALDEERPSLHVLVPVSVVSGLLALTHYWSLYLLATTAAALALAAWKRPQRRQRYVRVLAGLAAGAVFFLPWIGVFLYQAAHTGTPWGRPGPPLDALLATLSDIGGGPRGSSRVLGLSIAGLVLLALMGRAVDARRIEIDLRTRPGVRPEIAIAVATFAVALAASFLSQNAFASRYASVVVPLLIIGAAYGFTAIADARVVGAVLAVLALLGIAGGVRNLLTHRTQAHEAAEVIEAGVKPGDVVAACPDQLAVAAGRLLPEDLYPQRFPDLERSKIINWVDYGERNDADPGAFVDRLLAEAGDDNAVWLIFMTGYRTLDRRCELAAQALAAERPGSRHALEADPEFFERHYVMYAPPVE